MEIQPITFRGDVKNGKKLFEKLSRKEQIIMEACERSRQKYNETHFPGISQKEGDLADYIRMKVSLNKVIEKLLKDKEKIKDLYRKARNSIK